MRSLRIPIFILLLTMILCLYAGSSVKRCTDGWKQQLQTAAAAMLKPGKQQLHQLLIPDQLQAFLLGSVENVQQLEQSGRILLLRQIAAPAKSFRQQYSCSAHQPDPLPIPAQNRLRMHQLPGLLF